jgi:altronate hydrolase
MSNKKDLSIRLSPADNVVVARLDLLRGTELPGEGVKLIDHAPAGHKIATAAIVKGDAVVKYSQVIGFANCNISPGQHVHVQNCEMADFERDYAYCSRVEPIDYVHKSKRATFQGYRRSNGKVGTRNYIGILTSVNCSATVARYIADAFNETGILKDYPYVDGVVPFVHSTGCGMAGNGDGYDALTRTLFGYASHPNFAGILMVNQIPYLMKRYGMEDNNRFQHLTIQQEGGTRKAVDAAIARIKKMLPEANAIQRETVPASELTLALQCGGSDGYSGITSNPALGSAVDLLVRHGGTAILSETPEIYGAEHLLTMRAVNREIGEKLIERIKWWEDYAHRNGGEMNNNPSPGNKDGGLTTILEKSLGAAAKGGTLNLAGVYKYAEQIDTKGLCFMDSPGYDPCSVTGQVASGANVICFTTGRGSVFGFKPAPSIKVATNTRMFTNMSEDMDINAGSIADGERTVAEVGEEIFRLVLAVASGDQTKSEELGFGGNEFIPWQIGAVM